MTEDEIEEFTPKEPRAAASAFLEKARVLAIAIITTVQKNSENLTEAGIKSAVASRIADFAAENAPRPEKPPTKFTNKRPTKPGWYWAKKGSFPIRMVELVPAASGIGLHAVNIADVNDITGTKWCGPIEVPT